MYGKMFPLSFCNVLTENSVLLLCFHIAGTKKEKNWNKISTKIAEINVKINEMITMQVAMTLVDENIFFNWFRGPIKKHVLQITKNKK